MLLAKLGENYIEAEPNSAAYCPHCGQEVISKCGDIKIWHWAHKNKECQFITEPETQWHKEWKNCAKNWGCVTEFRNRNHILDAFNPQTKTAFEFQHSPISQIELKNRSLDVIMSGYKIVWVFDVSDRYIDVEYTKRCDCCAFKIKWYNHTYDVLFQDSFSIYGQVYLDFGKSWFGNIVKINKMYPNGFGLYNSIGVSKDVVFSQ